MNQLINIKNYPIDSLESETGLNLLSRCQARIAIDGALVLGEFLLPETVNRLLREAISAKSAGHRMAGEFSAYSDDLSEQENPALDASHPQRTRLPASHLFIAGDRIGERSPLREIYQNPGLLNFIQAVMGVPSLYLVDDPLGCINLLTYEPDDCNGWHFDTTEFVVSILLQAAQIGGEYQYIPALRSDENENLHAVSWQMQHPDDTTSVQSVNLKPGSLFLFKGKNTLHRVTTVKGETDRIVAILSYHQSKGHWLSDGSRQAMYGRIV
jgi:hypothetical protein